MQWREFMLPATVRAYLSVMARHRDIDNGLGETCLPVNDYLLVDLVGDTQHSQPPAATALNKHRLAHAVIIGKSDPELEGFLGFQRRFCERSGDPVVGHPDA